jgi:ribose transport system ATP-binding protein
MAADTIDSTINPILKVDNVNKSFGATAALTNVSLDLFSGRIHALVGENGAGKSTLMKILCGAIQADSGQVLLDGKKFLPKNPLEGRTNGVVMVYQELALASHLSVEENLVLGYEPLIGPFVNKKKMRDIAINALAYFDHPEITPQVKVGQLSVGAQQVVEIARAIVSGCKVLVLDEPTSSLSSHDIKKLFEILNSLKEKGMSIVYISHFLEEVREIADEVTVMRDGTVVGYRRIDQVTNDELVSLMVGRNIKSLYQKSARKPDEVLLEVKDLACADKPKSASLELRRGEVLGIAGLVGAGRTELLRAIFGLEQIKSGNIKLGIYAGPASPMVRLKQGMGMLSEDRKSEGLALSLSISDNMTCSKLDNMGVCGLVFPKQQDLVVEKWIDALEIKCSSSKQKVTELSGGNQQKVMLGRLLHHDVDVLLLDEPTRGIDVGAKSVFYKIIDELACGADGKKKKAVIVVSSYLPELMGICDRIAVMSRGRLGEAKNAHGLTAEQIMLEATG